MSTCGHRALGALTLGLGLAVFTSSGATACPACPGSFDEMLQETELVFRGTVTDITYTMSEAGGPDNASIPYTFVTYEVSELYFGNLEGDNNSVTLRFTGGWDHTSQLFMQTSATPLFDKGDHDILFVAGNNQRLSPIAGGFNGRLRIIDGQVYEETGREMLMHGDRTFRFGNRYFSPDVFTTTVGDGIMTLTMDTDENDLHFGRSNAISEHQAIRIVRGLTAELPAADSVFVNANPELRIPAPDMTPVALAADGDAAVDP